jgi:hypothetical protein
MYNKVIVHGSFKETVTASVSLGFASIIVQNSFFSMDITLSADRVIKNSKPRNEHSNDASLHQAFH